VNGSIIEIRKYPNRRLYDQTHSQHLTIEELYEMVVSGKTVRVTDSKTGQDITNVVLLQALIERDPAKLGVFPSELLHLMVRANEQLLQSTTAQWFASLLRAFSGVPTWGYWGGGEQVKESPAAGVAGIGQAFTGWPGAVGGGGVASGARQAGSAEQLKELEQRVQELMEEVRRMKRSGAAGEDGAEPSG